MSLLDAQKYMGSYQEGYTAAIEDAIRLYKSSQNFVDDISFLSIAVINEANSKIESFEQLAKDLGIENS